MTLSFEHLIVSILQTERGVKWDDERFTSAIKNLRCLTLSYVTIFIITHRQNAISSFSIQLFLIFEQYDGIIQKSN